MLTLSWRDTQKFRDLSYSGKKSEYMDMRYPVLASKLFEKVFSIYVYALTNRRRGILLFNLKFKYFSSTDDFGDLRISSRLVVTPNAVS